MQSEKILSVVIAGGGFCGVMTLVHLLKIANRPLNITLVNTGSPVGRGIAYNTYSDLHLLNVRAANMSAFPDESFHFADWCSRQKFPGLKENEIPSAFIPRNYYGKYLEEILRESLNKLSADFKVELADDEVTDVEQIESGMNIKTLSGKNITADKFVLATGNCQPDSPVFSRDEISNSGKYFANPWCEEAVIGLQDDETALIIGTGLTMVDVVVGLREKDFKGKIIALSPHGFNILSHREYKPQRFILDELSPPYSLETLFRLFYKHIRQARTQGESGETVVDAIRSRTQEIWQQLSLTDKKMFMSHLRHVWGVARHRLPASVHSQMRSMLRSKTLAVVAGRIKTVTRNNDSLSVVIQKRNQSELLINAGRIINCTGPQTDIRKQNSELYNNLVGKGIIRPDEMNLGVDATAEGRVIDSENNISDNIFALGSLLKGKLWESTAIPELRMQAKKVAEMILEK